MPTLKILIADDHALIRESLSRVLKNAFPFCEIGLACDGRQLIEKSSDADWDLIISDVSMPITGGLEAVRLIRKQQLHIPILVMSIHTGETLAAHAHKAGASAFISKSKLQEHLIIAIGYLLQNKKYFPDLKWADESL